MQQLLAKRMLLRAASCTRPVFGGNVQPRPSVAANSLAGPDVKDLAKRAQISVTDKEVGRCSVSPRVFGAPRCPTIKASLRWCCLCFQVEDWGPKISGIIDWCGVFGLLLQLPSLGDSGGNAAPPPCVLTLLLLLPHRFGQLQAVDVSNVAPTMHVSAASITLRPDVAQASHSR